MTDPYSEEIDALTLAHQARTERRGWLRRLCTRKPKKPPQITSDAEKDLRRQVAELTVQVATLTRERGPLGDAICGKWPGDETDEEIADALHELDAGEPAPERYRPREHYVSRAVREERFATSADSIIGACAELSPEAVDKGMGIRFQAPVNIPETTHDYKAGWRGRKP